MTRATPTEELGPASVLAAGDGAAASTGAHTLPGTNGADPTPNGAIPPNVDLAPPPGLENMAPLSATAMASFASAAKGVTTAQEVQEEGGNTEGLLVLNGSTA
jgi:poly(A) polymerase